MIKKMKKYSFVVFHKESKGFLSKIQQLGVVDVRRTSKAVDSTSKDLFEEIAKWKGIEKKLQRIKNEAKKEIQNNSLSNVSNDNNLEISSFAEWFNELLSKKENLEREKNISIKRLQIAKPWGEYNYDNISKINALGYTPHFYSVESKKFPHSIEDKYPTKIVNEVDGITYFIVLSEDGKKFKLKYKEYDLPQLSYNQEKERLDTIEKEILESNDLLLYSTKYIADVKEKISYLSQNADLYLASISSSKVAENHIDIFTAFSPVENEERIDDFLNTHSTEVYYIKEDATLEDNPPIALKNNRFTRMFSIITDMYGRPAYNEFDPTPYIAVFFMLFFAMCMGDAGYGIALVIVGLLLRRSKGTAKFAPLVLTLGVATFIIGIILNTFFGIEITKIAWVPDNLKKYMIDGKIANYDAKMVLALAIGVFHICVAMIVKAIYAAKNKGFFNSLGTFGWTLLIVGGVIVGAFSLTGVISKPLTKWIIIVIGILSALGIFFLNDLHRNPLANFGSGAWETYNTVTGLLGDVLSYIRLYALGLAGGMLGQAFNNLGMGVLDGLSVPGLNWFFFILIVVFGHVLNLAMSCLGAFVHPLRLNFLEFFKNSGYEGSGKTYNPLTTNK